MSESLIFLSVRKHREKLDQSPSEQESDDDITWIMDASDDACETGEEAYDKTGDGDISPRSQLDDGPPRSSEEYRMSGRERVIREVIDEGRETCHCFRTGTDREKMIQYPVDRKCSHHMPEDIECDMFRTIFTMVGTIEP